MKGGYLLSLDPRSRTESGAFSNGFYDSNDIAFFTACLDENDSSTVLDIGANVGLIAIPLSAFIGEGGRLLAFEPVAANAAALRVNIDLNKLDNRVSVIECALGDKETFMQIGRETGNSASTGNAYLEESATLQSQLEWSKVRVRRLDDVATELDIKRLALIKMDVEGAELNVLRGARQLIQACRPIIYGEFNMGLRPQGVDTFADVETILGGLDYKPFAFIGKLKLAPVKFEAGRGNAVLCPGEKVDWMLERCQAASATN